MTDCWTASVGDMWWSWKHVEVAASSRDALLPYLCELSDAAACVPEGAPLE